MQTSLFRRISVTSLKQSRWFKYCFLKIENLDLSKIMKINHHFGNSKIVWHLKSMLSASNDIRFWSEKDFEFEICFKTWKFQLVEHVDTFSKFGHFEIVWNLKCQFFCNEKYRFRFEIITMMQQYVEPGFVKSFKIVWNLECQLSCVEWYRFLVSNKYFDVRIFSKIEKLDLVKQCEKW